jgi:GxxExxY protein
MASLIHTPLADIAIGCAIEVHRTLGPGLLESTYERCLASELAERGVEFEFQYPLPVTYKGRKLDCGYRADLLIERDLILEIKSIERFLPVHSPQAITYLKLSGVSQVLLIDFNVEVLKNGIKSFRRRDMLAGSA